MDIVIEKLKSKNLKITPQRLAVYNILYYSREHPSADYVYKALEFDCPTLSLATVYKTLETFEAIGLITGIACREKMRYDANTEPHSHLICNVCSSVTDYMPVVNDENEVAILMESMNFVHTHKEVNFYGVCKNCSRGDIDVC